MCEGQKVKGQQHRLPFNMLFSQTGIIRRLVIVTFLFMADIIVDHGITPCASIHIESKRNSSAKPENESIQYSFLNSYLYSVLNRSKALEEIIYSDILNNLKSFIKNENNQSVVLSNINQNNENENETHDVIGGNEKVGSANRNATGKQTNSRIPVESDLSGGRRFPEEEGSRHFWRNVTPVDSGAREDEYFLGYGGNPFGSRRPISGLVEVSENDPGGRTIVDPRKKRSVLHLYNMVLCTTGCNPLEYKGYGCYCGFLGSGFAVDGIDGCCQMHDWCYNSAGCPTFFEYFIPYLWKCFQRKPLCAIDHGIYGGPGSCAQRLCECDRQLALCLRRYPCPSTKALCTSSPLRLLQNILML